MKKTSQAASAPAEPKVEAEVVADAAAGLPPPSPPGSRVIGICGSIDAEMVNYVMAGLAALNGTSSEQILLQISSSGGSLIAGWALYDLIATNPCPVITMGYGYVGSAATIAFQGGIGRVLSPNAELMIHEVRNGVSEDTTFTIKELRKMLADLEGSQAAIERMLVKRTGQSLAQIRKWCAEETEFSAADAVKFGFADGLLKANKPFRLATPKNVKPARKRAKQ